MSPPRFAACADVSEFRLRTFMQKSSSPFVISKAVKDRRPCHPQRRRESDPSTERRQKISAPGSPFGQPATLAAAPQAALPTELLQLCERFFTYAGP